jgi:hypothetical protein
MATRLIDGGQVLSPIEEMSTPDYVSYLSNERVQRFFNAIAPAEEGDIPEEGKNSFNVMMAPFGESAPFSLKKPYSRVTSVKTEIECVKPVVIEAHAMVDGITFTSNGALESEMIVVNSGTVMFRNCTFVLAEQSDFGSCVKINQPGKALFTGCYFVRQASDEPNAISSAAVADGIVVGCVATGYSSFGTVVALGSFV